jgi:CHAT domain
MATTRSFGDAITVTVPTGYDVGSTSLERRGRRRGGRLPRGRVSVETADSGEAGDLVTAVLDQGFQLAGDPLTVSGAATGTRRRGRARVDVTLDEDTDAVLLLEQDGVYSWRGPDDRGELQDVDRRRRSPLDAPVRRRQVSFELTLVPETSPATQRGWLEDRVFSKVRVFVLKYVARKVVGFAVDQLEAHVSAGLRVVDGHDPKLWTPLKGTLELPTDRPARVLLLVHGTFSSTIGGFGNLCGTPAGKKLLASFTKRYDLVLGYDHLTLSVDPAANAAELLGFLRDIDWPKPPVFDVVCHSRGSLVSRAFTETSLPMSGWDARVERIVHVGGPNAGTHLASPENWNKLVDLYTNLAAAASRLLPDAVAAAVLGEVIKGVGALVKLIVSYAVDDQVAPGLASMNPSGRFIETLNLIETGQRIPGHVAGYVIASDFEPSLALKDPKTLPKRFLLALADLGVDQLIGHSNDLVVDTASMSAIDLVAGGRSAFVQDSYTFDGKDQVFHTIYFHQQQTCDQIEKWLGLRVTGELTAGVVPPSPPPDGDEPASASVRTIPDLRMPGDPRRRARSTQRAMRSVPASRGPILSPTPRTAPEPAAPGTRRVRPHRGLKPSAAAGAKEEAAGSLVTASFRASMDAEAAVGVMTTVRATISREALAASPDVSDLEKIAVVAGRPITVQVVVKAHGEVSGEDRVEVPVPAGGAPVDLFFDVMPLAEGIGEVHVVARQGPVPMATLVLQPKFVPGSRRPRSVAPIMSQAQGIPPDTPKTCVRQWLRIGQRIVGDDQTFYDFELQADDLKILHKETCGPLMGDRATYVDQLYRRIEDRWVSTEGDSKQFMRELKAIGGELFDQLIPPSLGRLLWKHRTNLRNVLIVSDEPFIPWELVHLRNNDGDIPKTTNWFLAQLGAMRWLQGTWPADELWGDDVRTCVPDYPLEDMKLPATAGEAEYLKNRFGATAVNPTSAAVLDLLSEPGSCDIFHFAGHGEADGTEARLLLEGRLEDGAYITDDLNETTLAGFVRLAKPDDVRRPMVVFNACQAGRQVPKLTRVGGFASAMVAKGAGAFVSSLWSVGDEPAREFTRALYDGLLDGKTLAEASIAARKAAQKGDEATWLAYVVYGNPCAKLTVTQR